MKNEMMMLFIIVLFNVKQCYPIDSISLLTNCSSYSNEIILERPNDKENIERFWNHENESFLTSQEKETLNQLKSKVEGGQNLTIEEREVLSKLRCETITKKLGVTRFERYKKLIEKREKQERGQLEIELSKEEKNEIYNFEKEIKGKN